MGISPHLAFRNCLAMPAMHCRASLMCGLMLVQSSCPTPVGTPFRAMLPGDALHLNMPSADVSPQAAFGTLNPESLAALQAAFRKSLAEQDEDDKVCL